MKQRRLFISMLAVFILLMATSLVVTAQSSQALRPQSTPPAPSDNQVNRVAKQLYCPVCENISLDVCPTKACAEWRELIRQKLALGWTDQQIKDYFALQYGDRVLAEPPTRGLNLIVYILPPVAFLGGALILFGVLRRMRKPVPNAVQVNAPAATAADPVDPYLQRVEEELIRHEKD